VSTAYQAYHRWDKEKRDALVQAHLPLVYSIANRVARSTAMGTLEVADLVSVGVLGLYKACEKYNPESGASLGTYAAPFVRGAILDDLYQHKQLPRSIRDKHAKVKQALQVLHQQLMREPSDDEVATHLGIEAQQYSQWLSDLGWTTVWSVEELDAAGALDVRDMEVMANPELALGDKISKEMLVQCLKQLSDREQKVLYLYYQEELTLKEIAYILELSESQISRIHSKTVMRLRGMMRD